MRKLLLLISLLVVGISFSMAKKNEKIKIVCENRKAWHDYFIQEMIQPKYSGVMFISEEKQRIMHVVF